MITSTRSIRPLLFRSLPRFPSLQTIRFSTAPTSPPNPRSGNDNQQDEDKKKGIFRSVITWKSVVVLSIVGGCAWIWFDKRKQEHIKRIKEVKSVGSPYLGGPFSLIDHNGKPVTDGDYRGKFMLIYFGFTHCPDICPAELKKMSSVMDNLRAEGFNEIVQPIFITLDPWRDSVQKIRDYVRTFHPSIIGLTGTPETIKKVCKAFRVYSSKSQSTVETKNVENEDYQVDHSIILYLMGPDGRFVEFYSKTEDEKSVTTKLTATINKTLKAYGGEQPDQFSIWNKITSIFAHNRSSTEK